MGSPLGPLLADIFVAYMETFLPDASTFSQQYYHYVDDRFVIFQNREQVSFFFRYLNSLHPFLHFTVEHERDNSLAFLDV